MRLLLVSTALAFLFLLPLLGDQMDFRVPGGGWIGIPATGLGYMLVFFHELGHTASYWLFGEPAFPRFDFQHGGGMAHGMGRSWILLCAIWLAAAGLAAWLYREMQYRWLAALCIGFALHLLFVFTRGHDILTAFMGHGAEVLIGGFCMLRAFWNTTEKTRGAVERWLNMVFGLFAMGKNIIMTTALMVSDISRAAYGMRKGGHLLGDLERIGQLTGTNLQIAAGFLLAFTLIVLAGTIWLGLAHRPMRDADFQETG